MSIRSHASSLGIPPTHIANAAAVKTQVTIHASAATILSGANMPITLTQGSTTRAYLIGLSTFEQQPLLGSYANGQLCLNDCGLIVADEWVRSATGRKGIHLDAWSITPNCLHGIVFVQGPPSAGTLGIGNGQKPWLLSSFIAGFKAAAAKRISLRLDQLGQSVWQRSYDERLIADAEHLAQLRHQLAPSS